MKKEYDEIMEHIKVTPEICQRVLKHIQEADISVPSSKILRFSSFKKYLSVAACFVVLLAGAVALPLLLKQGEPEPPPELAGQGIEEVTSLQELSGLVGFEIKQEFSLPFDVTETTYVSYRNELAEIQYMGEEQSAVYRQSPGTDDNSGDYSSYGKSIEINIDSITITLKGDNDTFQLAVWTEGDYAYSLRLSRAISADGWNLIFGK